MRSTPRAFLSIPKPSAESIDSSASLHEERERPTVSRRSARTVPPFAHCRRRRRHEKRQRERGLALVLSAVRRHRGSNALLVVHPEQFFQVLSDRVPGEFQIISARVDERMRFFVKRRAKLPGTSGSPRPAAIPVNSAQSSARIASNCAARAPARPVGCRFCLWPTLGTRTASVSGKGAMRGYQQ